MIFITAKHDCMQFVLNKSSPILFKLDILLFFYPVNANVLPFVASLHSKSYFSSLEKGYQSRVATWFYSGSSFYFNVLVKFSSLAPLF